jgi:hypothetical protein
MTHTTNVLRLKTAKTIINFAYDADKSAAISADGLSVHGPAIDAIAIKGENGWDITINSTVFELPTLKSIVSDALAIMNAHKTIQ